MLDTCYSVACACGIGSLVPAQILFDLNDTVKLLQVGVRDWQL